MTTKIYVFLIGLSIVALSLFLGCKKNDSGALKAVDEVSINGIENQYNVLSTDTLRLHPILNSALNNVLDSINYDFYLINMGSTLITNSKMDTLSRNKNINVVFKLKSGQYDMIYKIVDKKTGIFYRKQFLVNVSSKFSAGFLLMSEVNGTARLDMLYKTTSGFLLQNDVLAKAKSALKLKGKPYFVGRLNNPFDEDNPTRIYLGTSEETNRVASETFAYDPSMNIVFEFKGSIPSPTVFKPAAFYEGVDNSCFLYNNNNIYMSAISYSFGNAINNAGAGSIIFSASKQIVPWFSSNYSDNAIVFDEQSQTFYNYIEGAIGVESLPEGRLFDFNIKKMLIYMGYTANNFGEIFAVLKDNDQPVYRFARFSASYREIALGTQSSYQVMNSPSIERANLFAVSQDLGYLFYAVDGKLYEYDYGTNQAKLMKDYGQRKISMIKFNLSFPGQEKGAFHDQLMVATYDEGNTSVSGQIDFFKPTPLQGTLTLLSSYAGMGKVVSALFLP